MGGGGDATVTPFRIEIERWRAVGGGLDRNGKAVQAPWALTRARIIDSLCQRYGCLPSQLLQEDMDILFQIHTILFLAGDDDKAKSERQSQAKSTPHNLANLSVGM